MKKTIINKFLFLLILGVSFTSCDKGGDPDPGSTEVVKMAGDWYVQLLDQDQNVLVDYGILTTYNTAQNNGDNLWIDDNSNLYGFKFKTPVNVENKTFSGGNLASSVEDDDPSTPDVVETYDISVNLSDGKILEEAATTSGGNVSDSIYFKAEFSDDPGTIYTIAGYKRTGFLEDEH